MKKRLEAYHQQTAPLVEFYESRGVLKKVSGTGDTPNGVFEKVKAVLGK